uniref:SUN domain-containing protein 2-like n=1 Tax=Phascolarctos cinereus TaxID=38626 RepID=A0A6P5IT06_PHACI|nr:SUN domain-containing protein 2-like [Phascolarctos cinereus]
MAIHFSGWLFGLLCWCLHNTWYCLTTAVSLQDIYVFTRSFSTGKKLLLSVLGMLFLVALLDYGLRASGCRLWVVVLPTLSMTSTLSKEVFYLCPPWSLTRYWRVGDW